MVIQKQSAASVAADEATDEWLGTTADETDAIVLHRFFNKHGEKIGKELLSRGNAVNSVDSAPDAKGTWFKLCEARVGMGSPEKVPEYSTSHRDEHLGYIGLMESYMHRNLESMQDIFVAMELPEVRQYFFCSDYDVQLSNRSLFPYSCFVYIISTWRRWTWSFLCATFSRSVML